MYINLKYIYIYECHIYMQGINMYVQIVDAFAVCILSIYHRSHTRLHMCSISPVFAFFFSFSFWSVVGKAININKQWSLFYQPKQCIVMKEILEHYHRFVLFDSPPMGYIMTPDKTQQFCVSLLSGSFLQQCCFGLFPHGLHELSDLSDWYNLPQPLSTSWRDPINTPKSTTS